MKIREYTVQYHYVLPPFKDVWLDVDAKRYLNIGEAISRMEKCKDEGPNWEYRVASRTVDYGEWEGVK